MKIVVTAIMCLIAHSPSSMIIDALVMNVINYLNMVINISVTDFCALVLVFGFLSPKKHQVETDLKTLCAQVTHTRAHTTTHRYILYNTNT